MAAANTDKLRKCLGNFSTTLDGAIDDDDVTISLASASGLPTDTAVTLIIDRVDADGDEKDASEWELVTGVISGNDLTVALRGEGSTSASAHSSGAVVECVVDEESWNDLITHLLVEHNQDGTHKKITVDDDQDIKFASGAKIERDGGDIKITPESGKHVHLNSHYGAITADDDGATITFNMATANKHTVTLGGNRTLAVSNVAVGQVFLLTLVQDATGSRTVTWFSTIKWAGGAAPTLTTTATKADAIALLCTSSGNYYGFVVGQNIG